MKRLILVGPGHAHLRALRDALVRPATGWEAGLIAPDPFQLYTGMLPGYLAGQYQSSDLAIDLPALCRSRGLWFKQGWVEELDLKQNTIRLATGETVGFDLVSLNLGGLPVADDIPGAREHATFLKPLSLSRIDELLAGTGPIVVVGGGAGGVEVALCLKARTGRHTTLVSATRILPIGASRATRRKVWNVMKERKIPLWLRTRVVAVHPHDVQLSTGKRVPYGQLIWVTGARAPELPQQSGAAVDDEGFMRVHPTMQSVSHPQLFGAGDAVTLEGWPRPARAGVHAVREGRVLGTNLRATMKGLSLTESYAPDQPFLSILNLGDGTAIATRGDWSLEGRAAFWLKDFIDRRWVRSLRP